MLLRVFSLFDFCWLNKNILGRKENKPQIPKVRKILDNGGKKTYKTEKRITNV